MGVEVVVEKGWAGDESRIDFWNVLTSSFQVDDFDFGGHLGEFTHCGWVVVGGWGDLWGGTEWELLEEKFWSKSKNLDLKSW